MSSQQPEAGRPEGLQPDSERAELAVAPSKGARLALILAVALIVLFVLAVVVLDPDLLRRWLSVNETNRLFGGPTPSN